MKASLWHLIEISLIDVDEADLKRSPIDSSPLTFEL